MELSGGGGRGVDRLLKVGDVTPPPEARFGLDLGLVVLLRL